MRNMTEDQITAEVLKRFDNTDNPRLKQIMVSLVTHLHGFVRDVELTEAEWFQAIQFLTAAGQICDDTRQEFILLSDTLGVSMLVDLMQHRTPEGATESTVFGPFYRDGAPELEAGGNVDQVGMGEATFVAGRVLDMDGQPIANALLDLWQTAPNGLYEVQDAAQPDHNMRGKFHSDADGRYLIRTARPVSYPVPFDGPAGRMLEHTGRHPYRPAHIHFIVSADGFEPVTTHLFDAADGYLDSDAVFGVKESLITEFTRHDSADEAAARGCDAPFYTVDYDFVLTRAG